MNELQNRIYKEVAQKLNKDPEVVEKVCKSIFEFLAETMREGKYEPYRIQGLGLFEVKPYTREKSERSKKYKEEKEARNREIYNSLRSGNTSESHECGNDKMDSGEQEDSIL